MDSFDRPDQPGVGNNWIEETPGVFSITNDVVTRVVSASGWTTNMVYRPATQDVRDLEVSMEFIVEDATMPDWPQIFVRGLPASFDAYYVWVETGPSTVPTVIDLARKPDDQDWWTPLAQTMVPPAVVGGRYRLRLRATGASPVVLDAWYEIFDGTSWDSSITMHAEDRDPDALVGASTWGFDGHTGSPDGPYVYDNYSMTAL